MKVNQMTNQVKMPGYFSNITVSELALKLRKGETSSLQLTKAALDCIVQLNPILNAFVHVATETALNQAMQADAEMASGIDKGPLHGIPVAIKDNIDTKDMPTTYGTRFFADHRPARDARCVENLRRAGAIAIGKTLTSEFAMGPTGEYSMQGGSRNPHDTNRVCGGSSAGSACAVSAGMVPLAVGTDTGGSIRIPSAFCGITGFKPTYQKIPMDGVFPVSNTLDHIGPLARTCTDAALLLAALSDENLPPPNSAPQPIRAAWLDSSELLSVDPEILKVTRNFVNKHFASSVSNASLPCGLLEKAKNAIKTIFLVEAFAVHSERVKNHDNFCPPVVNRLQEGHTIAGWTYLQALQFKAHFKSEIDHLLDRFDVILLPTTAIAAPRFNQSHVDIERHSYTIVEAANTLTGVWNLIGYPVVSVPAGSVNGLPVGIQAIGRPGQDHQLLNLMNAAAS